MMPSLMDAVKIGAGVSAGVLVGLLHPELVATAAYLVWVRHLYFVGDALEKGQEM